MTTRPALPGPAGPGELRERRVLRVGHERLDGSERFPEPSLSVSAWDSSRILVAYMVGFFLALGPFDHVVVSALHVLLGIWLNGGVTYHDLLLNIGVSTFGNVVGGLLLITFTHSAQFESGRGDPTGREGVRRPAPIWSIRSGVGLAGTGRAAPSPCSPTSRSAWGSPTPG